MSSEYKRIRDYELMIVLHPELSEEDLVAEIARTEGHITTQAGTIRLVNREAPWGRRRLSYPIRHSSRDVRDGFYVLIYFTSESSTLGEIEREIKLDDKIIRYLLTQQTAPIMEPTPIEEEGPSATAEDGAVAETSVVIEDSIGEAAIDSASEAIVESTSPADSTVEPEVVSDTAAEAAEAVTTVDEPAAPVVEEVVADSAIVDETSEEVAVEPDDETTAS